MNRYKALTIFLVSLILLGFANQIGRQLSFARAADKNGYAQYVNADHGISIDVPADWDSDATRRRSVSSNGAMLGAYSISLFSSQAKFSVRSNKSPQSFWVLRLNAARQPFNSLNPPFDDADAMMGFIYETLEGNSGSQVENLNAGKLDYAAHYQSFSSSLHNQRVELYLFPRPNKDYFVLMLWSPFNVPLGERSELARWFVESLQFAEQ